MDEASFILRTKAWTLWELGILHPASKSTGRLSVFTWLVLLLSLIKHCGQVMGRWDELFSPALNSSLLT